MLLSAYLVDESTFQCLWAFAKSKFDSNGLMNWKIDSSGNIAGSCAAAASPPALNFAREPNFARGPRTAWPAAPIATAASCWCDASPRPCARRSGAALDADEDMAMALLIGCESFSAVRELHRSS